MQKRVYTLTTGAVAHRLCVPEPQEDGQPVTRIATYEPVNPAGPSSREK